MLLQPLSLMGSSYADNALAWAAQRTLNWLPETAEVEGTRTPVKFADPPGLRAVVDLGTGSPIRGLRSVEGALFAVSSTSLFEISTAFAATNRGSVPGVKRVSMAHNKQGGATAANELVIANGLSGYVYNTNTQALVQITDDAFQGATSVDYVDGFITFTDPQGRFWGHSALNQATSFSSIDRYDAESAPDPILSHIVSHREVMVFGTRTIEFFRNAGTGTGTFQRVNGTELEVGICAPFARSLIDNSVCWVGDSLEVFRLEGHAPQRISTRPIEQLLATVNPANIFTFAWEDRGHKVFYVTAPEAFTVGFDFASGMWHERQTFELPRWRVNDLVAWNGYWIAGDFSNGLLYVLDWDTHHENGLPLIRERASGYTHAGQNKVLAPYVELLFDVGPDAEEPSELLAITGDVPDGDVGDTGSGAYIVSGGITPYGAITVLSGTPPPDFTLNPDGTYTYDYTTAGSYTWTVGGVDAEGNPFSTTDSADVADLACSAVAEAGGSTAFPIDFVVGLGTAAGPVHFDFDTYAAPDKFHVIYDGVTIFDSGYVGEDTAAQQTSLNARLAVEGLPPETMTGQGTNLFTFTKGVGDPSLATVRVFSPGSVGDSQWAFLLGCPNAPATHQFRAAVMADAPFSFWRFTEPTVGAANFIDYGSNYTRLLPSGGVTSGVSPLYPDTDFAVTLDGINGFLLPSAILGTGHVGYRHAGDYTWAMALEFTALPTPGNVQVIVVVGVSGEGEETNVQMQIGLNNSAGTYRWNLFHESGAGVNNFVNVTHPGLVAGQRYLMHFVRDTTAKTYTVYADGVLLGSGSYTSNATGGSTTSMNIGRNNTGTLDQAAITLDELAFFKSALSVDRIEAHAEAILA